MAFDGGFASKANLATLEDLGVKDVMFHKKRGLEIPDMTKSKYIFKKRMLCGVGSIPLHQPADAAVGVDADAHGGGLAG